MSKDMKVLDDMGDYVRQLKRHTEGRIAVHVRMSALEKHYREQHYRLSAASALRPLVTKYGAVLFALPTADIVLITKDASVDIIDTQLNLIRRHVKEASLVADLDPVQGVSDAFTEWFDLEAEYAAFVVYTGALSDRVRAGDATSFSARLTGSVEAITPAQDTQDAVVVPDETRKVKLSGFVRMTPIKAPETEAENHEYDIETVQTLVRALASVDVTSLLRRQNVKAVTGKDSGQVVMVHKFVPEKAVFETLLKEPVVGKNLWLEGYFADFLADRLLASKPDMREMNSLAVSLQVTCSSIFSKAFNSFDSSLQGASRHKIILEFHAADVLTHFGAYQKALEKLAPLGYKTSVSGIDLSALPWIDHQNFRADFIKVALSAECEGEGLTEGTQQTLRDRIQKIGIGRLILDKCQSADHVKLGQQLGITLFQGDAVDPPEV